MKRKFLPLFVIILIASFSANAQLTKGNVLLGANLGFNYSSTGSNSGTSNANISPRLSLAVGDHSAIGILGNFGYSRYNENVDSKSTSTAYSAGLFWKRYIPLKNKWGWYLETDASVTGSNMTDDFQGTKTKTHAIGYSASIVPGVYYQALPKLFLSANVGGIGFSHSDSKASVTTHYSALNFNLFTSFVFSFDFIFG